MEDHVTELETQLRQIALHLAADARPEDDPAQVVERAAAYLAFLNGDGRSPPRVASEPAAGSISLGALRRAAKATGRYPGEFTVEHHPSLEADVRALPNFTPVEKYSTTPLADEIGRVEVFQFFRVGHLPLGTWTIL